MDEARAVLRGVVGFWLVSRSGGAGGFSSLNVIAIVAWPTVNGAHWEQCVLKLAQAVGNVCRCFERMFGLVWPRFACADRSANSNRSKQKPLFGRLRKVRTRVRQGRGWQTGNKCSNLRLRRGKAGAGAMKKFQETFLTFYSSNSRRNRVCQGNSRLNGWELLSGRGRDIGTQTARTVVE